MQTAPVEIAPPADLAVPAELAEPGINHQSFGKNVFHLTCLLSVFALSALLVAPLVTGEAPPAWGAIALGAAVGLLLADFASGLAHWAFDTYGTEATPLIGQLFIKLFRVHHDDPMNITRTPFIRINGDNSMLAGLFLLAVLGLGALGVGPSGPFGIAAIVGFAVAIAFTNLFHQWSHRADPPAFARLLHRFRIVLTPAAHARHHKAPHRSSYCITLGWMNPVLDAVGFFPRLEAAIRFVSPGAGDAIIRPERVAARRAERG